LPRIPTCLPARASPSQSWAVPRAGTRCPLPGKSIPPGASKTKRPASLLAFMTAIRTRIVRSSSGRLPFHVPMNGPRKLLLPFRLKASPKSRRCQRLCGHTIRIPSTCRIPSSRRALSGHSPRAAAGRFLIFHAGGSRAVAPPRLERVIFFLTKPGGPGDYFHRDNRCMDQAPWSLKGNPVRIGNGPAAVNGDEIR